jgi:Tol biopolymer transport system component
VQTLDTGERKTLIEGGADARYVASGHLVYVRRGTLLAVPFSVENLSLSAGSVTIVSGVMQSANMPNDGIDSGAGQFATSTSGTLAYVPGSIYEFPDRLVVWIDRFGKEEQLKLTPRPYMYPHLSPDGQQIAISTQGDRTIWLHDMTRNTQAKLTTDGRNVAPVWTPDGQGVVFGSSTVGAENLFLKRLDSSILQRITTGDRSQRPAGWSKSSDTLVYTQWVPTADTASAQNDGQEDIWVFEKGKTRSVVATRFNEIYPDFSPDGRWLAYTSNESGRNEVYVVSYPQPGAPILISTGGGVAASWNPNGRELFYIEPIPQPGSQVPDLNRMMSVAVATSPKFIAGRPLRLFEARFVNANNVRGYDVSPDGQRFLAVRNQDRPAVQPNHIVIVQNWTRDLARMLPGK